MAVPACAIEVQIVQAHIDERILVGPDSQRIDPDKWRPLVMSFRQFYGLGERVHASRLGESPEDAYAPWKLTGLRAIAGKALGKWARYKYED